MSKYFINISFYFLLQIFTYDQFNLGLPVGTKSRQLEDYLYIMSLYFACTSETLPIQGIKILEFQKIDVNRPISIWNSLHTNFVFCQSTIRITVWRGPVLWIPLTTTIFRSLTRSCLTPTTVLPQKSQCLSCVQHLTDTHPPHVPPSLTSQQPMSPLLCLWLTQLACPSQNFLQ